MQLEKSMVFTKFLSDEGVKASFERLSDEQKNLDEKDLFNRLITSETKK